MLTVAKTFLNMGRKSGNAKIKVKARTRLDFTDENKEVSEEVHDGSRHGDSKVNKTPTSTKKSGKTEKRKGNRIEEDKKNEKKMKKSVETEGAVPNDLEELNADQEIIRALVNEDDSEVILEVKGQAMEFNSEVENTESENESDDSEAEEEVPEKAKDKNEDSSLIRGKNRKSPKRGKNLSSNVNNSIVGPFRMGGEGPSRSSRFDEVSDVFVVDSTKIDDEISDEEMKKFAKYMKSQGLMLVESSKEENRNKFNKGHRPGEPNSAQGRRSGIINGSGAVDVLTREDCETQSEVTIYWNAVQQTNESNSINKRNSSSSDEPLDTSDEIDKLGVDELTLNHEYSSTLEQHHRDDRRGHQGKLSQPRPSYVNDGARLHCSRDRPDYNRRPETPPQLNRREQLMREGESNKVHIMEVPGNEIHVPLTTSVLDEDYLIVGNHVEEMLKKKIANGEYVDFAKLIPKD